MLSLLVLGVLWSTPVVKAELVDPGTDGTATFCSNGPSEQLINYLGGTPDPGGSWVGPDGAHSGTFVPGTDVAGVYTYTVTVAPDPPASATVTVTVVPAPNAGTSGSHTVCSNGAPFNLIDRLGGAPQGSGTWTGPGGGAVSGTFTPGTSAQGMYTYSVTAPAPCAPATATVTVTVNTAPNAGVSGSNTVCSTSAAFNLIDHLGGTPQATGSWTGPGGGAVGGSFTPGTSTPGIYTYTVTGTAPCAPAITTVTVTVNTPPTAGSSGTHSVCSNGAAFALIDRLGGSPPTTGAWTGPGGSPVSGTYTPGTSNPGIYTYTVAGLPPCPAATATVTVTQTTAPNAGVSRSINVCSDEAPFLLTSRLNGTPDLGGTWTGPNGPQALTFDPAAGVSGSYVYTVAGSGPCSSATATLTITMRQAPNAGTNGTVSLCSTDGVYTLFNALTGGPDVGGTWTDPGGQPHSGNFTPGSSTAGTYTYTVSGQAPCTPDVATVVVTVITAPNAGSGTSLTRCSNAASFNLFAQLGGSPNTGGTWTGPNGAHGATFNPATDTPGAYTYTVNGTAPCANATAVVNVAVVTAPRAGTNGTIAVCGNAAPFSLFAQLGGTPDATGSWTGPGGSAVPVTFTPGTSAPGLYTYTVPSTAPCANATATVNVTVVAPPNPGTNGAITVCSSDGSINLFTLLGGSPATGGTWTRPDGTAHSGTYVPSTQPGGNYTYTVVGTAPCANRSAVVQVTRVIAANAGTNGTITVCSTNSPFPLISVLGGNPNGTGSWLGPNNASAPGTFDPATSPAGQYKYVVVGTAPCVNDTGFVTVSVNQAPNAGQNASTLVCSNAAVFPLFGVLGGTPNAGGSWTGPSGGAQSGTFTPGTSTPGGYTYTVPGQTPCLSANAVVVVNVNRQPVAGTNGSFTRCSTDGPVDLFGQLGGTPDAGGSWVGPGGPSSGVFIPGTGQPGTYTYTVTGTAPCTNVTATVVATVNQAPNAGVGGTLTVCQGTTSVDLFTGLSGTPDLTGAWTEINTTGNLSGNFFNPNGLPPGNYDFLYTVAGIGQCTSATATVRVTIVPDLEAGSNGTLSACRTNTQVNLFNGLGGGPQQGGQWIDLGSVGAALTGQFFNASLVAAGSYQFRYRLIGIAGCDSDSAQVTVTVVQEPNAGVSSSTITCSNSSNFSLFTILGGSPNAGGVWRRGSPTGPIFSGTYNPMVHDPDTYYYVVSGSAPCVAANAWVVVQEVQEPNAGRDSSRVVCADGAQFNMTQALGGTPDAGGTWFFNNQNHGPVFVPGLDAQGVYEYRVSGTPPCAQKVAFLNISVTPQANAGLNSSTNVCSGDDPFLLFNALGGNPNNNGTWLRPDLSPSNGTFNPANSPVGDYRYIVTGAAPCVNDTAIVSVFVDPSPDAGDPGAGTFCANQSPVNLLTLLGGTPDPFGTWVGPAPGNPPFSGQFNPATSAPGLYTYTVTNTCGSDVSTVNVSVSQPANAGCSASTSVCTSSSAFSMVAQLTCSPAFNGTWTGPLPANTVVNGVFTPGTSVPGTYVYTVLGQGACPSATATLSIAVNPARNAGNDASVSLCRTDGLFQLFPLLGPSAQAGGSWFFSNLPHTPSIQPSVDLTGTYTYVVYGSAPCPNDTARVFVQISEPPYAGTDGLVEVCSNAAPFQLINFLGGSPALNGLWFRPNGTPHSGIFTPGTDVGGAYKYRVAGNSGCPADSSFVTVIQSDAVDAGDPGGQIVVCSNGPEFELFDLLNGSPQMGGDWFAPDGSPFTGTYFPGTSQPGVYKYKRIGTAPCPSDSATVTVFENTAPNAGISTLAEICSTQGPTPLIDLLSDSPDNNGSWTFNNEEHGPFFEPSTDLPGAYVYTVQGQNPCAAATAQVVITVIAAPNAGSDGAITACVGSTAIDLGPAVGPLATSGGLWTTDCAEGTLTNGVFDATGMLAGASCTFTYTHAATGACPMVSSEVTVTVVDALDAGEDAAVDACLGQIVNLYNALQGMPQLGGTWVNVDGANGLSGGFFNTGAVASGTTWRFDYVLAGSVECDPDTGRVTVEVLDGPFAGCDGNTSACTTFPPFSLITSLTCGQGSDGPDPGGSWFGPAWAPHSGIFQPAVDASGNYYYVVDGFGSCPADTARVNVNLVTAPNAGADATLSICSTDPQQGLFALLGPNAQTGGSWFFGTGTGTPHSGVYNPAIDVPGTYRYRVQGAVPCAADEATVIVTEPVAPNAGCDASIIVCSGQAPFLLRNQLTCSPSGTGTWTYVTGGNVPHGDSFNPASDPPGVYRHLIIGTSPCASDSAEVTISVVAAGNAGQNATIQACASQTDVDLFVQLGPEAQSGGSWTDIDNSQALTGSNFNPSVAGNGTWRFRYTIAANGPCPAVFRAVTVVVGGGGSAGQDSSVAVCANESEYDLFQALGGSPTAGGTWSDPTGTGALIAGGLLNAGLLPTSGSSPFVYTINDPSCGLLTAVVQVSAVAFPVAGTGGPVVLCSTAPPIELFFQLTGGPQPGGVWTDPLGELHGGTFTPGVDAPGNYTYTVPGTAPCADATAVVTMTVNAPPDAGENGLVTVCDTLLAYALITGLNGDPDAGGSWADLDGSGGLSGGSLNTTGLAPTDYEFRYTVSVPGCTPATSVLKVNVITSPVVTQLTTTCNTVDRTYTVTFTVEQGDADSYEVIGLEGELSSTAPYTFVSVPLITSIAYGAVIRDANGCAEYEIEGESPCSFITQVFVPESFSPNGDGINETFRIPGIEGYPNNSISIFNRWGGKIFEGTGYDNSSVVWDGSSPDALISGNAATGTYFYVLDLGNGAEPITGFIQLVR